MCLQGCIQLAVYIGPGKLKQADESDNEEDDGKEQFQQKQPSKNTNFVCLLCEIVGRLPSETEPRHPVPGSDGLLTPSFHVRI